MGVYHFRNHKKAIIILDDLDISILKEVDKKQQGVLELVRLLDVRHPSVRSHLSRLEDLNAIKITPTLPNRKIITLTSDGKTLLRLTKKCIENVFD